MYYLQKNVDESTMVSEGRKDRGEEEDIYTTGTFHFG